MRRAAAVVVALAALALGACGKKGPPVAPETRLPLAVVDLSASVIAGGVDLRWTNPAQRIDGSRLRDLAAVHVFRTEDFGEGRPRPAVLGRGRILGYVPVTTIKAAPPPTGPPATAPASRPGAGQPATIAPGAGTRLDDRYDLTFGRRYTYVVVAEDTSGRQSPPSNPVSVTYLAAPTAPSRLQAKAGESQVELTWEPPAPPAGDGPQPGSLAYEVLRGTGPETPLETLTAAPLDAPRFLDRNVQNDRTYHYAVRALRLEGQTVARGDVSARVAATPRDTTPPAPPTDLVAAPSAGTVRLSWRSSPDADVRLYVVYRAAPEAEFVRVGSVAAPATVFADRDVPAGTWRYAVSAQDAAAQPNEGARTPALTVTVP
jgi:hypothetical protein